MESTGSADRRGAWSIELRQPLLQGAGTFVNYIAIKQARNKAAQSVYSFRQTVLSVVQQTETAYWNLVLAHEVLAIREFAVTLAAEQLTRASDREYVGRAIESDVLSARAELASRTADLTDAQSDIRAQNIELIKLLNPADTTTWKIDFTPRDLPEPP